jgi:ABC-type cobalt transport system substrate-binding protein
MTKQLNIDIIAKDKTKRALTGVQNRLNSVKSSVFSLKGALIGIGAGAAIRSFVNVGKEVESLQVRFKFLFGSVEEGAVAFDNLTKFAGKVPFSLEEISRASGNLAVVADDANDLNRILEITGNVAAVTGLDFETTSSQIQRAFSGGIGAADLFRERGVRALLGFQAGAKVTAEETVAKFEELFAGDGRFAKATKDLATTLEGTISMIGDKYFNFQKDVAAGFFDELKGEFGDLNTFLEENEQQIKDIATAIGENFAGALTSATDTIKDVAPAVKNIANALGTTIEGFKSLPTFVQTSGIISVLLFGKKGAVAFGAISFLVGEIDKLIDKSKQLKGIEEAFDAGEIDIATASIEELELLLERIQSKIIPIPEQLQGEEGMDNVNADLQTTIDKISEQIDLLKMAQADADSYAKIFETLSRSSSLVKDNLDNVFKGGNQDARDRLALDKSQNKVLEENNKRLEQFRELQERVTNGIRALKEAYDPYLAQLNKEKEELKLINIAKMNGLMSDREYERLKTEILAKGIEDRKALKEQEVNEQLQIFKSGKFQELKFNELSEEAKKDFTIQAGKEVLGALAKNNKKAFELNKALATAEAIVNTAQGVTKALSTANYIGAFLIGAMGAVQIASIQSQQYQGRAMGGRVQAGSSYMVGEGGKPEMFVPDQSGTIVPNSQLARQTTVNLNVYANDTEGFDNLLVKRRSVIVNVINDALNSQGKEALI